MTPIQKELLKKIEWFLKGKITPSTKANNMKVIKALDVLDAELDIEKTIRIIKDLKIN